METIGIPFFMKKWGTLFVILSIFSVTTGCVTSNRHSCLEKLLLSDRYGRSIIEKLSYETVNGKQVKSDKTIYILTPDSGGAHWYLITECYWLQHLLNPPETINHVCDIKASKDGRYLAVVSSEEGHPHLQIMNLGDVLSDRKSKSLMEISPYPGYIRITGWKGNHLYFTSDILMSHRIEEDGYKYVPRALELFSWEEFKLNMADGRIEAVSENIKTPVDYYGRHLLETPDDISPAIELAALEALQNTSAIPYLETALTLERYADHKDDIRRLMRKLNNSNNE